jgi:hypothetical protein
MPLLAKPLSRPSREWDILNSGADRFVNRFVGFKADELRSEHTLQVKVSEVMFFGMKKDYFRTPQEEHGLRPT